MLEKVRVEPESKGGESADTARRHAGGEEVTRQEPGDAEQSATPRQAVGAVPPPASRGR